MYTTRHAQRLYNVKSDQTIRNWIKEFQEFFSANTSPGKGVDLQLTDEDMSVLSLIASMRAERRPAQDIYVTLKSGQRGDFPEYTSEQLEALVKGDTESYLTTQVNELNFQIAELTDKLDQANKALQPEREARIRAETERAMLEHRLEDITKEMQELRNHNEKLAEKYLREIAELRYKMGLLEKRDDKGSE